MFDNSELYKFHIIKDERLASKREGKTNFSRLLQSVRNGDCWVSGNNWRIGCNLQQFDGLTWLTLIIPYFTTDLRHWVKWLTSSALTWNALIFRCFTHARLRKCAVFQADNQIQNLFTNRCGQSWIQELPVQCRERESTLYTSQKSKDCSLTWPRV